MKEEHLGSTLDDFLEEEGLLAEAETVAVKRVLAFQLAQLMAEQKITKSEMARRMNTSRTAVERLLDPESEAATLTTLEKAASALGKRLHVELV
jgi:DNA-binding Xre family transcriptional regulator